MQRENRATTIGEARMHNACLFVFPMPVCVKRTLSRVHQEFGVVGLHFGNGSLLCDAASSRVLVLTPLQAGFLSSLLGSAATVEIKLHDQADRKSVELTHEKGRVEKLFLFHGNEDVRGQVTVAPAGGKRIEHQGMKIELIGQIGL
jgi:hypothetical protein